MVSAVGLAVVLLWGSVPTLLVYRVQRWGDGRGRLMTGLSMLLLSLTALMIALSAIDGLVRKPRVDRIATRSTLRDLEQAIAEYESDHAAYPPSDGALSSRALVIALDGDPGNGGPEKAYYDIHPDSTDAQGRLLDVWGRPLRYRRTTDRYGFDLWSTGADLADPADDLRARN